MKKFLFVILLGFFTNVNAGWEDWTSEQKKWYIASNLALVADWATTRDLTQRYHEGYRELNPILGSHPSIGRVNVHFISALIGHYFVTDWMDQNRTLYLQIITVSEGTIAARNIGLGLRLRF